MKSTDQIQCSDKKESYNHLKDKSCEYIFESPRLGFREWKESDKEPFAKMNANKDVMKYFTKTLNSKESNRFIYIIQDYFNQRGYGLWAVEIKETKEFIGFIGFLMATFESEFTPCVEIGWRLDNRHWYKGYATEGAKACLEYGFDKLHLDEIYSFTSEVNQPSQNVMKKIGLKKIGEFPHPRLEETSELRPHVLYKIDKSNYKANITEKKEN